MVTTLSIIPRCIVCLLLIVAADFTSPRVAARAQGEAPTLTPDETVEAGMAGGETRLFRVTMSAGQYLRVVVEQRGIDLTVALIGPGSNRLLEMDSPNGSYGPE
ncbi:MAG TPA: hypothetical protein VF570_08940, partial [Pyrinomonadaceae bacterium]